MQSLRRWFGSPPDRVLTDPAFPNNPFDLRRPLLGFTHAENGITDYFTIEDATKGVQVFGGIGSGKTSGSGAALALSYLNAGMGGLILTAKSSERQLWEQYCRMTHRTEHLRIFSPESALRLNFLQYAHTRPGRGGNDTQTLVSLLVNGLSVVQRNPGNSGEFNFWREAVSVLLSNAIDLLTFAGEPVTLYHIFRAVHSAATSTAQVNDLLWRQDSYCWQLIRRANDITKPPHRQRAWDMTREYWALAYPALSPPTRTSILATFITTVDGFLRGVMGELFDTGLTITPEWTHEGGLLLMDLPTNDFENPGRLAQTLMKLLHQQALLRRENSMTSDTRPVFLWADEAQDFLVASDQDFQNKARSVRACSVYLTQSLENYYEAISPAAARGFLASMQTKIFHASSDVTTNSWASELIASTPAIETSASVSDRPQSAFPFLEPPQTSITSREVVRPQVYPYEFIPQRTGGPRFDYLVDAILFQSGTVFRSTNTTFMKAVFRQPRLPALSPNAEGE